MSIFIELIRRTQKWSVLIVLAVSLIALPFFISWAYDALTALPEEITIAAGPKGGLYLPLSESLAEEIETQLQVKVHVISSNGSLENLLLLQAGKADFALYQPGVWEVIRTYDPDDLAEGEAKVGLLPEERKSVAFVANLYSQPAHFIVHRDANIRHPNDLQGKRVAVGLKHSGNYAMSLTLLEYFNLRDKVHALHLDMSEVEQAFQEDTIDAAFFTMGVHAPIFRRLAKTEKIDFIEIPNGKALSENYLYIYSHEIPAGLYSRFPVVVPDTEVKTVAAGAQLLTRADVKTNLVEAVTKIVLDKNFIRENQLGELFAGGYEFALRKPEFQTHQGAQNVYEPELRPLVNPDFILSIEHLRSFIFAAIVAIFLGWQWLKKQREDRLEQYMESLLDIERQQMFFPRSPDGSDIESLRQLLAKVTFLRQEALHKFSAHEFSGDRAADCFIQMCASLSNKINAKMSRRQLDKHFDELTEVIKQNSPKQIGKV